MKISQQLSKVLSGHYFQTEIFKGYNSLKNVGQVMVLNLCTSSYDALYLVYICIKFHESILNGIKVIEQTQFSKEKNSKVHNSIKNVDGVTVIFSAHRLTVVYICTKFCENILNHIKVIKQT